jgi:hypothetical protein
MARGILLLKIEFLLSLPASAHFLYFSTLNSQLSTPHHPLQADQRVGQWSDVVSIPVAG